MFDVRLITSIKSFVLKYNYLKFETFFDESFAMTSTDYYIFILHWIVSFSNGIRFLDDYFYFQNAAVLYCFCKLCHLYFPYSIRFGFEYFGYIRMNDSIANYHLLFCFSGRSSHLHYNGIPKRRRAIKSDKTSEKI